MDVDKATMTVVGRVDAKKLRDRVANKTKKKVDITATNNPQQNHNKQEEAAAGRRRLQGARLLRHARPRLLLPRQGLQEGGRRTRARMTRVPLLPAMGTTTTRDAAAARATRSRRRWYVDPPSRLVSSLPLISLLVAHQVEKMISPVVLTVCLLN
jgi:hypothetical protein